jgi:ribose/xylose/arabinose/galactoside ABC-type transport system permease subunit
MSAVIEAAPSPQPSPARGRGGKTGLNPKYLPLTATISLFVLMATLGSVFYDGFFSAQVFLNLLIDNAFLIVVAVGMTFVILSGGIDLSVGSVIALTTMVSASLVEKHGWSPAVVIPLVLAMGTAFGAFMGLLIERFRLQPFIVTLAGMFLARGLCYLISIDSISITNAFYSEVSQIRIPIWGEASLSISAVIAIGAAGRGVHCALHAVRPRGVRHRRQRAFGHADGPAGAFARSSASTRCRASARRWRA